MQSLNLLTQSYAGKSWHTTKQTLAISVDITITKCIVKLSVEVKGSQLVIILEKILILAVSIITDCKWLLRRAWLKCNRSKFLTVVEYIVLNCLNCSRDSNLRNRKTSEHKFRKRLHLRTDDY